MALTLSALLTGCGEPTATDSPNVIDAFSVQLGQCTGPIPPSATDRLTVLPCGKEHNWEAFGATKLVETTFPGSTAITKQAGDYCERAFADFIGLKLNKSKYSLTYLEPTQESWDGGDREIICLVGSAAGGITGSLDGSNV